MGIRWSSACHDELGRHTVEAVRETVDGDSCLGRIVEVGEYRLESVVFGHAIGVGEILSAQSIHHVIG